VTEIGYDITMNGVEMGSGQTDEGYSIPSYSTETVEFTTALQNRHLDDWWVTHLDEEVRGHQVTGLRIEFYAVIEFPTGEEATIPLDALTYEETIETDIFDEGNDVRNASESSEDGSDDGGDGDDGGETSDGTTNGGNTTDGGNEKRTTATPPKTEPMTGRRTEPTTATTGFCRYIRRRPVRPSPRRPD